ncbi:MAG: transcription termination/antitermination protein NusG [Nitrospirota bacterium]
MLALPIDPADGLRWYAVSTRSRHEKQVRDHLAGHGIEPLLPLFRRGSHWSDRTKEIDWPVFPGYCFARFSWRVSLTVLKTPGVVRIIGGAGKPEPIPDSEMEVVKKLMITAGSYESHPYLREGTRVRIVRGALEGVEGILAREGNRHRVVISVNLIQQAAAIEVRLDDVEAVGPAVGRRVVH